MSFPPLPPAKSGQAAAPPADGNGKSKVTEALSACFHTGIPGSETNPDLHTITVVLMISGSRQKQQLRFRRASVGLTAVSILRTFSILSESAALVQFPHGSLLYDCIYSHSHSSSSSTSLSFLCIKLFPMLSCCHGAPDIVLLVSIGM